MKGKEKTSLIVFAILVSFVLVVFAIKKDKTELEASTTLEPCSKDVVNSEIINTTYSKIDQKKREEIEDICLADVDRRPLKKWGIAFIKGKNYEQYRDSDVYVVSFRTKNCDSLGDLVVLVDSEELDIIGYTYRD